MPDDFILVGVDEMPEKPVVRFLVNERSKASAFWASPYVQLDHIVVTINASLKRRPVSHLFPKLYLEKTVQSCRLTEASCWARWLRDEPGKRLASPLPG